MEYNCPRCNYSTNDKYSFIKHINKVFLCKPINSDISLKNLQEKYATNKCLTCMKQFTSSYKLNKHLKEECKQSNIDIAKENINKIDNNNQEILQLFRDELRKDYELLREEFYKNEIMYKNEMFENKKMREELSVAVNEVDVLKKIVNTLEERLNKALVIVNNTQNIDNSKKVNIVNHISIINTLGNETIDHLSKDFMVECMMNGYDGLADYIMKKHFDPNYPANHNIKVTDKHLKILYNVEAEQYLRYPKIYDRELYSHDKVWLKVDKDKGICDGIIPSIESAYSDFYQIYDKEISQLKTEHFIDTIIGPLDWSLRVNRLSLLIEEYDFGDDDDDIIRQRVCNFAKVIQKKLDYTI